MRQSLPILTSLCPLHMFPLYSIFIYICIMLYRLSNPINFDALWFNFEVFSINWPLVYQKFWNVDYCWHGLANCFQSINCNVRLSVLGISFCVQKVKKICWIWILFTFSSVLLVSYAIFKLCSLSWFNSIPYIFLEIHFWCHEANLPIFIWLFRGIFFCNF